MVSGAASGLWRAGGRPDYRRERVKAIPQQSLRCNERIRVTPIRLIDAEGNQAGIVETREAQAMARDAEMDLVEVAPQAKPPVCRIMDYGKWKYAQRKKERKAKARRHETEMKEVRIRTPKIGAHDLEIKVARARNFIERGDRVQFTLRFRGRELAHLDVGRDVLNSIKASLADVTKVERDFRMEGRRMTMVLASTVKPPPTKPPPQAATPEQALAVGKQAPAAGEQAPAAGEQAPAAGEQAPAAGEQAPATGEQAAPPTAQ